MVTTKDQLSEKALNQALTEYICHSIMDKIDSCPAFMHLNQDAIDYYTVVELNILQKDGIEGLPSERIKPFVNQQLKKIREQSTKD